ncbi:ABC transporter substrate-binding protein [Nocardia sp. BMG51109]|uniref:ABC transporter substrate-binding protein n=1 Tax=Nocardia sp. BMG51109 TaxID=1056816 RepID=UPI000466A699|nr:ABC transporter substrate-binding protein [Nocardia sp. BMG51109]
MTAGWTRRAALRAGLGVGVAGGIAGIADLAPGGTGGRGGGSLRIGYLPITDAAPLLVGHEQGYFARAGLATERPVLFRGWESLAQAFLTGAVDVVHLLMPFAVQLRYALGADITVLGWNHTNGSAVTVAPDVRELGQLAGRSLAIPFWWSIHNVMVQRMLRAAGLRPVVREDPSARAGTVRLVVLSPADMLPALHTGTIGAYVVADPFNAAAEAEHAGRILRFVGDAWRDHACCVVVVRGELVRTAPDRVQALTDGLVAAQRGISGDRRAAAGLLSRSRYLPQPLPAITRALTYPEPTATAAHPGWQGQRIGFAPYPFPSFTDSLVDAMRDTVVDGDRGFLDGIGGRTAHRELVDDRFVRHSLTDLGGPAVFGLPPSLTRIEEIRP